MYQTAYQICGVSLCIKARRPLPEKHPGTLFQKTGDKTDMLIQVEEVPEIIPPDGIFCGTAGEERIWRTGREIFRSTRDLFRRDAHIAVQYSTDNLSHVTCRIREADWVWAAGPKYFWPGIAINSLLLHFRTLIFHAAYVGWRGQGILFTAPSGTGKSTQAELWRGCRGAAVLNGDKAGVRLDGTPMVHGVPFSGTSGICRNVSLPLRAVAVLSQAPENTVRRLTPSQAAAALCPNVFADSAVGEEWQMMLNLLLDLVSAVPVYALACTPDERAVAALEAAIAQE